MSQTVARSKPRTRVISLILTGTAVAVASLFLYQSAAVQSVVSPAPQYGDVLPDGVTAFDDDYAGIVNLDPALLDALRSAASAAAADGIHVSVTSGWRSPDYQNQLLSEAVDEYGSAEEAARWVATADTSPHVTGDAVDIGSYDAMDWMAQYGSAYGLCQIYGNEPWHYELRTDAAASGCPQMFADPTEDPRMG